MRKIKFCFQPLRTDIIVWRKLTYDLIFPVISNKKYIVMDTDRFIHISLIGMIESIGLLMRALMSKSNIIGKLIAHHSNMQKFKYLVHLIISGSYILGSAPKVVITDCDNHLEYQLLDFILYNRIKFVTIQNGNRPNIDPINHSNGLYKYHQTIGFHSCFAALSSYWADAYNKSRVDIVESFVLGSLNLNYYLYCEKRPRRKVFDVCVVADSDITDVATKKISQLINNYVHEYGITVCLAFKQTVDNVEYYNKCKELFGDCALLVPRYYPSSSLYLSLCSEVTISKRSTLLTEALGMGRKIYPVNLDSGIFAPSDLLPFSSVDPDQNEFNSKLFKLLMMPDDEYFIKYKKQIQKVKAYDHSHTPYERITELLSVL
jgi:hypothetical protein